ncbi:MAG: phosphomannomutase CpsG, partial [Methylophilaceae bacterium]|nr:phosphomannomutase CpsG [Methylophilaceae bacterium]
PDGDFPNGIPNPMLNDNRVVTAQAVRAAKADMGVAWDGDFDRCFLFDADGQCIEGYYIVGLLASAFLAREAGATIVYDPRLTLNTEAIIQAAVGRAVMSKAGHAFIKETMRRENAIYGGEMSAHHYFRDFSYCDSGMIPWLLVCELMSHSGLSLAALVGERMRLFPCSGEINFIAHNVADILNAVRSHYQNSPHRETTLDGLSLDFEDWRFNLRGSNTEPLLRLNIEACASMARVQEKMAELEQLLGTLGAHRDD